MQQFINGLALGSSYALLGIGVTLVWGVLHILTFAHAQMMAVGAFAAMLSLNSGSSVVIAVLVGVLVSGTLSAVMDLALFTPLRKRNADVYAFVVVTIGVGIVMEALTRMRTNSQSLSFPRRAFPVEPLELMGRNIPRLSLVMLAVSIVVMLALGYWLQRTKSGFAVRAVAHSRDTGELLGINTRRVFATCFFVSGVLAALSGIFIAASSGQISHSSNDPMLLLAFSVIVLGGMGSVRGAIVGGLLLGMISVYVTVYISPVFREAIAMFVILVILVARPSGLFGEKATSRV